MAAALVEAAASAEAVAVLVAVHEAEAVVADNGINDRKMIEL